MFKTFSIKSTLIKLECCWQGGALRRPNRHPQGRLTDLKTLQNSESVTVILYEEDDKGCVLCCHEDWRMAVNQGLLKAVHHNIIRKGERCCWPHHSSLRHQAHHEPSDTSGLPIRPSVELCWPHHCPDDICTEQLYKMTKHADLKTARKAVHFIKLSTADLTSVVTSSTVVSGGQIEQDRTGGTTPHLLSIYFLLFIKKISWFSSLQYSKF